MTPIRLIGTAFGTATAEITFFVVKRQDNGADLALGIHNLELRAVIETFFYGYNLKTFLRNATQTEEASNQSVLLYNFDQTLTFEFLSCEAAEFLSVRYISIAPEMP